MAKAMRLLALAPCMALWPSLASGSGPASRPATVPLGIAAKYPGDIGIGKDPAVILHEDFETPAFDKKKWTNISNRFAALKLTQDRANVHGGRQALEATATIGKNTGGHLFARFPRGYEQMYARFYVKFAEDIDYIHHFVHMNADSPASPWPVGRAGLKPDGDKKFSVAIEPWGQWGKWPAPGGWHFYCYWWKMPRSKDGKFWGRGFADEPYAVPQRGKWYCVEFMTKCNTPAKDDGQVAFWLDGAKLAHHKGINWRSDEKLRLNAFWLMLYVTTRSVKDKTPGRANRVWFDDVVVATEYIGPVRPLVRITPDHQPRRRVPAGTPTYRLKQRVRKLLNNYGQKDLRLD